LLSPGNKYSTEFVPGLLNGVTLIKTKGSSSRPATAGGLNKDLTITAIPYYSWANRGQGEMSVWLNTKKQ